MTETALERLERRRRERDATETSHSTDASPKQTATLLVVDDEAPNLDVLRRQFEGIYRVEAFESGEEALRAIDGGLKAELILSDQRMPGLSGVEFLQLAAGRLPHSRRLILSGYTERKDLLAAINGGQVHQYVTKPWQPDDLMQTLAGALQDYRDEEARRRETLRVRQRRLFSMGALVAVSVLLALGLVAQKRQGVVEVVPDDLIVLGAKDLVARDWVDNIPVEEISVSSPVPTSPESVARGKSRYEAVCTGCHGQSADGDGAIARIFKLPVPALHKDGMISLPEGAFAWVTAHGIEGTAMKSMQKMLQPGDPWDIVNYLSDLAARRAKGGPDSGSEPQASPGR